MPRPSPAEVAASRNSSDPRRLRELSPDERLARIGLRQHRQVTGQQLRAAGLDKHAVAYRVQIGRLHPVFNEVFSLGGPPRSDRELWMAAVLTYGTGTKLGAAPAAELYGLLRYPLGQLHVVTVAKRRPRHGIVPHHRSEGVAWRYVDGIPVTSPEQTILDCATVVRGDRAYRRIVRQAQVDDLTSHVRLLAFAAANSGRRGVARLKRELSEGPSRTRSGFEDEVLDVFRHGGEPLQNHRIGRDEVDLFFPRLNVAIEVDGPVHDNPTAQADDAAKQARLERRGVRVLRLS